VDDAGADEAGFYWVRFIEFWGAEPIEYVACLVPMGDALVAHMLDQYIPIESERFLAWGDTVVPKPS